MHEDETVAVLGREHLPSTTITLGDLPNILAKAGQRDSGPLTIGMPWGQHPGHLYINSFQGPVSNKIRQIRFPLLPSLQPTMLGHVYALLRQHRPYDVIQITGIPLMFALLGGTLDEDVRDVQDGIWSRGNTPSHRYLLTVLQAAQQASAHDRLAAYHAVIASLA